MTIKTGDIFPSAKVFRLGAEGIEGFDAAQAIGNRRVIVISVPGAFSPACNDKHLPGYVDNADKFKASGIDEIICISVNDVFVHKAWAHHTHAQDKITFWSDGNGDLARALGLEFDGSETGFGKRCQRSAIVVDQGCIEAIAIEEKFSDVDASSAGTCLIELAS